MINRIENSIKRIIEMEFIFDTLQNNMNNKDEVLFKKLYQRLVEYYESNEWKEDFHLDELGLLPSELKRGILSEDGIYNFITSLESE